MERSRRDYGPRPDTLAIRCVFNQDSVFSHVIAEQRASDDRGRAPDPCQCEQMAIRVAGQRVGFTVGAAIAARPDDLAAAIKLNEEMLPFGRTLPSTCRSPLKKPAR